MKLFITLAALIAIAVAEYDAPTVDEYNTILADLKTALRSDPDQIPRAVRLAFHDCVGNACDGCINLDNASNNGLAEVIDFLEALYVGTYDSIVSRADFWQIASIAAIERAITTNNNNCATDGCTVPTDHGITFYWGRDDCATAPTTTETHEFPEPTMSRTEMMDYYSQHFGFDETQVTALMGAHTLGGAEPGNSGYVGVWVSGEKNWWNNNYYTLLIGDGVTYSNDARDARSRTDKKWQWGLTLDSSGANAGFMINTDVELCHDIDVDAVAGTTCTIGTDCAVAETYATVEAYANNYDTWMADFVPVYEAMAAHGYTDLAAVA